jgi:hypothetical protein
MMAAIFFSARDHTYEPSYNGQAGIKNKRKKQCKKIEVEQGIRTYLAQK